MAQRIQVRRGTAAQWASVNPVLADGEPGMAVDTGELRLGDGASAWLSLEPMLSRALADSTYAPASRPSTLATSVTPDRLFDKARSIYNLKPEHLRRYRAALARAVAGTGLCRIGFAADSITIGKSLTSRNVQAWPSRLRDFLVATGVPLGGTGWVFLSSGDAGFDPRFTVTTGWTLSAGSHFASAGSPLTFVSDKAGTVVEVLYSNARTAGTAFTVTVDGGTPQTVTIGTRSDTTSVLEITGLPDTTHTVTIQRTAGDNALIGAVGVRKASGLVVDNGGISGSKAADWATANWWQYGMTAASLNPALVFVALGTNDMATVTPATFRTQLETIVGRFPSSDKVLVAQVPGSGLDWTAYRSALYEMADALDLPLLDMHDRWGDYATANSRGLMLDGWHPNAVGYVDYARAALGLLT